MDFLWSTSCSHLKVANGPSYGDKGYRWLKSDLKKWSWTENWRNLLFLQILGTWWHLSCSVPPLKCESNGGDQCAAIRSPDPIIFVREVCDCVVAFCDKLVDLGTHPCDEKIQMRWFPEDVKHVLPRLKINSKSNGWNVCHTCTKWPGAGAPWPVFHSPNPTVFSVFYTLFPMSHRSILCSERNGLKNVVTTAKSTWQ